MAISELKKKIVIDNYFKCECDVNTSIKEAYTKGFELGLKKAPIPKPKTGKWIRWYETIEQEHCTIHDPHCKCSECNQEYDPYIASLFNYCPNCGRRMVEPQESEVSNG